MSGTLCRDCCALAPGALPACPACGSGRVVSHAEIEALAIGHVDCDAFYASVEKRDRPELVPLPLIVGHEGGRGVVTTACYVARRFGVRSAMPMWKALELCPEAIVLPPDMGKYKSVSDEIRAILALASDCIEPVSLDEAYLDLSEARRKVDLAPARLLARIARRIERDVRITVSIGLGPNKFLAKLASDMRKPRGFSVIGAGEARAVLAGMPVGKIHGVGAATARRLEAAGITTIGQLQSSSEMQLVIQFGRFGRRLAQFAAGEDDRSVTPDRPTKSISAETTFDRDTGDAAALVEVARGLADTVARRLAREELAGGSVVLKLKTSDFRIISRSRRLPSPTLRAAALLDAARLLIEKEADGRTFRLIGIGADALVPAAEADPPDLFS